MKTKRVWAKKTKRGQAREPSEEDKQERGGSEYIVKIALFWK